MTTTTRERLLQEARRAESEADKSAASAERVEEHVRWMSYGSRSYYTALEKAEKLRRDVAESREEARRLHAQARSITTEKES